jgi:uncharacterized membrane protein
MSTFMRPSRAAFAVGLIGLGILGFVCGSSTGLWDPIPKTLPGRATLIFLCSAIELAAGVGLLFRATTTLAIRVLLPFLLVWLALLKLPVLLRAGQVMVSWESFGEIAAITAGAWCVFAAHAGAWDRGQFKLAVGENGVRIGRLLLIAALPMFGLAHFAYPQMTASLVPAYFGFPLAWVYLTGSASIAAAAGMLLGIWPRLAVNLEAAMLWIFTLCVWVPKAVPLPRDQGIWSELLISATIAAAVWLVADTYHGVPWLAVRQTARAA